MKPSYTHYGWHVSFFAGITRAYLRCKGLDFEDKAPNAWELLYRIPKEVGVSVMPVVKTSSGEWLQDTQAIMDELERQNPEKPMIPKTPKQLLVARLIEAWATEFWFGPGVHWRWHYPENRAIFDRDLPRDLFPFMPPLGKGISNIIALGITRKAGPGLGVRPRNVEAIESWTLTICDHLEAHFAKHKYLLGDHPSIADFALSGPFYGHLSRDPAPRRILMLPRPNLLAWLDRTQGGAHFDGEWLANDEIPETLTPILQAIVDEMIPMCQTIGEAVARHKAKPEKMDKMILAGPLRLVHRSLHKAQHNDENIVPRFLKESIIYPMGDSTLKAKVRPFAAFKMQKLQDEFATFGAAEQKSATKWLDSLTGAAMQHWDFGPKMVQENIVTRLVED